LELEVETLHHVSVPVSDLARARDFYGNVLGFMEIARPPFPFDGAWYRVGDRDFHLIVAKDPTFRAGKGIDSQDGHFALRVKSFRRTLDFLESKGFRVGHQDAARAMRVNPDSVAGFPQIYILDPDRNVIEINAERRD
jgi:catechol 2,3-dioxygenase-like lactoylglutathione lyase family enzyme